MTTKRACKLAITTIVEPARGWLPASWPTIGKTKSWGDTGTVCASFDTPQAFGA